MDIQDKIKSRREELGLTYEEIGKIVGVSKSTVRKWETGMIENMRQDKIALLARALKVSPGYLMGWEDNHTSLVHEDPAKYEISTIAAHAIDDLTEEEQKELIDYAKYLKSKRK